MVHQRAPATSTKDKFADKSHLVFAYMFCISNKNSIFYGRIRFLYFASIAGHLEYEKKINNYLHEKLS
jgi:hypothetical protein